jgi:predicted enzyme related to lactoylglutathione lyase
MLSGHIAAVMVHAPEPAEALAWYERVFPAAKRAFLKDFKFTYLQVGALRLEFVASDEKVKTGPAGTVVYWEVEDLEGVLGALQALGATLYRGPMAIESDQFMCQVQDPWGNCVGIRGHSSKSPQLLTLGLASKYGSAKASGHI